MKPAVADEEHKASLRAPYRLEQPLTSAGQPTGKPLVAADSVGAGVGEHGFFVRGREASFPYLPAEVPTDAAIVAIVDHWTHDENGSRTFSG